jgi:hypothetical protein
VLFFAKTFRYIYACRVRLKYVSSVSKSPVSASTAKLSVLADSTLAFQNVPVLEAIVVFGFLDFLPSFG